MSRFFGLAFVLGAAATQFTSPAAAQVQSFGGTTHSVVDAQAVQPDPFWVSNNDVKKVAYGIYVETWNASNDEVKIVILGTKKQSDPVTMYNSKDNYQTNKPDYFLIPGAHIGDVGVPIAIQLIPTGHNAWGGKNVKVDYFHWENDKTTDSNDGWFNSWINYNIRDEFLMLGNHWDSSDPPAESVTTVSFDHDFLLSADESDHANSPNGKYYSKGAKGESIAPVGADLSNAGVDDASIPLSDEVIVIDARFADQPVISWSLTETQSVSMANIKEAIKSKSRSLGFSNTFTVSVSESAELKTPTTKDSVSSTITNAFTVTGNHSSSSTDKTGTNVTKSVVNTSTSSLDAKLGHIVFIELKRTAVVQSYKPFAGAMNRIGSSANIQYGLTSRTYAPHCPDGALVLQEGGKPTGPAITETSQAHWFGLARQTIGQDFDGQSKCS